MWQVVKVLFSPKKSDRIGKEEVSKCDIFRLKYMHTYIDSLSAVGFVKQLYQMTCHRPFSRIAANCEHQI